MEHCDQNNDDVCLAHKGVEARGQIKFITTKKVETLTCSLYGKIGGVGPWIPFPGGGCPKNGCASLSEGKCPLSKGTSGTYDIKITPPTYAPDIKVTAKIELKDGQKTAICITLPIKIVEK